MKKKSLIWMIGILIVIVLIVYFIVRWQTSPGQYDDFAKCLTEKGVIKYGTDWCHFCQEQKSLFGRSFKHINYINCDFNKAECNAAGVRGYPTWKIGSETYSGVQSLEKLSALSGCEI